MRICLYTDPHFSQYSSIVRSRGEKFSTRLENLVQSISWVEELAKNKECDLIICLGDFFDRTDLNAEEITALSYINWSTIKHIFLVGNHEASTSDLLYNSTQALSKLGDIIKKVHLYHCSDMNKTKLLFLPYISEENRKPLKEYIDKLEIKDDNFIILSHNDIKDYNYGGFVSKTGFSLEEIKQTNALFINGHIHNSYIDLNNNLINIGNLTGQNFNEDAFKYKHGALILDTDTNKINYFINPYAFKFYNINIDKEEDINKLNKLEAPAIVMFKCNSDLVSFLKSKINTNIIKEYRTIIYSTHKTVSVQEDQFIDKDYLNKFKDFITNKLGEDCDNNILNEEVNKIIGGIN